MSKLTFYDASFPISFKDAIEKLELSTSKNNDQFVKILKKRSNFSEFIYTHTTTIVEKFIDIYGKESSIQRLLKKEVTFRIYNRSNNNLVIINQPRSILHFRNFLSQLFFFDFYLEKREINLKLFLENEIDKILFLSKIDIREIIYPDNIYSKCTFYTQNRNSDLLNSLNLYLKSNHYVIFKIEFFIATFPSMKISLTQDANISFLNSEVDEVIEFFSNCLSN